MTEPPLEGWRVAVSRAEGQAGPLTELLEAAGAEAVEVPTIEIAPPRDGGKALREAVSTGGFDWVVFTSANAVAGLLALPEGAAFLASAKVAAVGKATAATLSGAGFEVDLVPERSDAEALAASLGEPGRAHERVLLPQSSRARAFLAEALDRAGYEVVRAEAYETRPRPADDDVARLLPGCQAIVFTSPSTFQSFASSYGLRAIPPVVVSIGPVTTEAIEQADVVVSGQAESPSAAGLVEALVAVARQAAEKR